ncbi:MAG: ABC transporter ATP-binding protein [Xanthobacteraceae bacterium]
MKLYLLLFKSITGYLRWRVWALVLLMVLVSVSEGLSVTLLLPLLSRVGISATGQGATGAFLNGLTAAIGTSASTVYILVVLILVALVQAALFITLQWCMTSASRGYQRSRQSHLFRSILYARWEFVIGRKAGELTSAIVGECTRLAQTFYIGLYLAAASISACVSLILALIVAWPITLGLMACALLMIFAVLPLYRHSYATGRLIAPLNAELHSVLAERISGIKIVKATCCEDATTVAVDRIFDKLERANAKTDFLPALARGMLEFLSFSALALIFVLGQKSFGIAPGNVIVVFALFMRLFPRITTVQSYLHMLNGVLHSMDVIEQLQATAQAHAERVNYGAEAISVSLPTSLALRGVEIKLDEHEVLKQVHLTIPVPGMVGIVGSSGAGKSTLVHALLGLAMPTAGTIALGTYDLASVPFGTWRRLIGYVPQETILFHTSIRDNLTIGKPSATVAEIELAAKRASAHDFISQLPRGYDTIIGDQGVKLSGGQRQRLGIARALLMNPILLLMDEAMSALDAESEAELLCTLEELRKQMGILIVAHRLAAVRTADAIYVIEAGQVVENGTWNELMRRRSRLYALADTQSLTDYRSPATL